MPGSGCGRYRKREVKRLENMAEIQKCILYVAGLWGACLVFLLPLERRQHFPLRICLSAAAVPALFFVCYALTVVVPRGMQEGRCRIQMEGWADVCGEILLLLISYAIAAVVFRCCVRVRGFELWYCSVWAFMVNLLFLETGTLVGKFAVWLPAALFIAGYVAVGLTAARWMPEKGHYTIGPRQIISAWMLCAMTGTIGLFANLRLIVAPVSVMLQFYCVTILYLQSALFKKSSMRKELDMIHLLWHQQKEQYRISRETIDLINHKCHDLKHQVGAMRKIQDDNEREKYLQEIENSVQIYNAIVRTGNEILDTILTEKSLLCENKGIHINCVADGALLSFMDPVDLYTLFGNAVDNAIEAVRKIDQKEKRVIDIMIYERQKLIAVQIVNPVEDELKFEDGLPLTTKAKNGYHGFGMKSMRHTVEKYGGYLRSEVKDGCFYLKIMVPQREKTT